MYSLELVEYINASRKPGEATLRHDTLMAKAPQVLKEGVQKFLVTYQHPQNGQFYPRYRFPKRGLSDGNELQLRAAGQGVRPDDVGEDASSFGSSYRDSTGRTLPMFNLPQSAVTRQVGGPLHLKDMT